MLIDRDTGVRIGVLHQGCEGGLKKSALLYILDHTYLPLTISHPPPTLEQSSCDYALSTLCGAK